MEEPNNSVEPNEDENSCTESIGGESGLAMADDSNDKLDYAYSSASPEFNQKRLVRDRFH